MSIDFEVQESSLLKGVYILTPSISNDSRGNIWTSFLKEHVEKLLPDNLFFKHDKFSHSKYNVLRGIHGDNKSWKLVTCVYGHIQQVVVDMRKSSSSFKKWQSFDIHSGNQQLILIPPEMGNAYYVKSTEAVYHYKLAYTGIYSDAEEQFTLNWNDTTIGIKWETKNPILSNRDSN